MNATTRMVCSTEIFGYTKLSNNQNIFIIKVKNSLGLIMCGY